MNENEQAATSNEALLFKLRPKSPTFTRKKRTKHPGTNVAAFTATPARSDEHHPEAVPQESQAAESSTFCLMAASLEQTTQDTGRTFFSAMEDCNQGLGMNSDLTQSTEKYNAQVQLTSSSGIYTGTPSSALDHSSQLLDSQGYLCKEAKQMMYSLDDINVPKMKNTKKCMKTGCKRRKSNTQLPATPPDSDSFLPPSQPTMKKCRQCFSQGATRSSCKKQEQAIVAELVSKVQQIKQVTTRVYKHKNLNVPKILKDIVKIEKSAKDVEWKVRGRCKAELNHVLQVCETLTLKLNYLQKQSQQEICSAQDTQGELPSLQELMRAGLLRPGNMNLSFKLEEKAVEKASLWSDGKIRTQANKTYRDAEEWSKTFFSRSKVSRQTAYKHVFFYKQSLLSLAQGMVSTTQEHFPRKTSEEKLESSQLSELGEQLDPEIQDSEAETYFSDAVEEQSCLNDDNVTVESNDNRPQQSKPSSPSLLALSNPLKSMQRVAINSDEQSLKNVQERRELSHKERTEALLDKSVMTIHKVDEVINKNTHSMTIHKVDEVTNKNTHSSLLEQSQNIDIPVEKLAEMQIQTASLLAQLENENKATVHEPSEVLTKNETKAIVHESSEVLTKNETKATVHESSEAHTKNETKVTVHESSEAHTKNETKVAVHESSEAHTKNETKVTVHESSEVLTKNETKVTVHESSEVLAKNETKATVHESSEVLTKNETKVTVHESSEVLTNNETKTTVDESSEILTNCRQDFDNEKWRNAEKIKLKQHWSENVKDWTSNANSLFRYSNRMRVLTEKPSFTIKLSQLHQKLEPVVRTLVKQILVEEKLKLEQQQTSHVQGTNDVQMEAVPTSGTFPQNIDEASSASLSAQKVKITPRFSVVTQASQGVPTPRFSVNSQEAVKRNLASTFCSMSHVGRKQSYKPKELPIPSGTVSSSAIKKNTATSASKKQPLYKNWPPF